MDELESVIAMFEAKLGSLPDEAFEHPPKAEEDMDLALQGGTEALA